MDFLNKAFAQITDLFRSMTPGARITAGLLLAVVVVSLAYLFNHQSSSPDAFLMEGVPIAAGQMPAMEAAFAKANLNTYEVEGTRIRIPHGQQTAYMAALADANALPKGFGDHLTQSLEKSNPFMSTSRQNEMIKVALQQELAQIVSSMHGIESASVLYDSHTEGGLKNKELKTASVSVKPQGNEPLGEERVPLIRQVVAGALGCKASDVSVADLNSDRIFPGGDGADGSGVMAGLGDLYSATKRRYEKDWEDKIRDALSYIPTVKVGVNVELTPELDTTSEKTSVEPKTVPIDVEETSRTSDSQGPATPGGRPGLGSQGGVGVSPNSSAAVGASSGAKTLDESTHHRERNAVSEEKTVTKKAPLTPTRVTVTVAVLSDYYEKIWLERNPTPAGADPKPIDPKAIDDIRTVEEAKIKEYVTQLLPLKATIIKDPTDQVKVTTFQHIATAPIALPTTSDKALFWLSQYWTTLGMIGLGGFSLLILRSMARSAPASETPRIEAPVAGPRVVADEDEPEVKVQQEAAARLKRRAKSGPSLRDELVEIVREDPDAAANILRNWIGSAT